MTEKISNEVLANMIKNLDTKIDKNDEHLNEKVDNMAKAQAIQNGRTYENSLSIAGIKGAAGVISLVVSIVSNFVIAFFISKFKQ